MVDVAASVVRQLLLGAQHMRDHLAGLAVFFVGAALAAGGCGSVSVTGGTGGGGGSNTGGQAGATGGATGAGGQSGATGTAGQGGSAGAKGSGGSGGSAGGAGGAAGSAGHPGAGNGGHGGGGSAGASGGHAGGGGGTGGHAGAGGAGGHADAGQSCDDLASAFAAALPMAQSCTPGAPNQCAQLAYTAALGKCRGCESYVNDAATLDVLRDQYDQQGCAQPTLCPQILCIQPRAATCVANDASSGGTCQVAGATTTSS